MGRGIDEVVEIIERAEITDIPRKKVCTENDEHCDEDKGFAQGTDMPPQIESKG